MTTTDDQAIRPAHVHPARGGFLLFILKGPQLSNVERRECFPDSNMWAKVKAEKEPKPISSRLSDESANGASCIREDRIAS